MQSKEFKVYLAEYEELGLTPKQFKSYGVKTFYRPTTKPPAVGGTFMVKDRKKDRKFKITSVREKVYG